MKPYLKLELKKNLLSVRTLIGIIFILGVLIYNYIKILDCNIPNVDGVDCFLRTSIGSYLCCLTPIISILYCTTIVKDKETGFLNKILEVIDVKTYIKGKVLVNAIINLFVFVVSYGSWLIFLILCLGLNDNYIDNASNGFYIIKRFLWIFESSKLIYAIVIILLTAVSAIALSTLVLGITALTQKRFMAYLSTILIVVVTSVFMDMSGLNSVFDFSILRHICVCTGNSDFIFLVHSLMYMLIGGFILLKSEKTLCK